MIQISRQIHTYFYNQSGRVIIVPHRNPDGDALGSAVAFLEYLHYLHKQGVIYCPAPVADRWSFLRQVKNVSNDSAIFKDPTVCTIVVLDSGDLQYAGISQLVQGHPAQIINIDHHNTNEQFGHFNLVIPTAASTTEVLYTYFKHNNIPCTSHMATALLTGFITDTDSFSNSATTPEALAAASDLIHQGAHVHAITHSTVKNKSVATLKLWGVALSRLKKHEPLNLTYTYITQQDLIDRQFDETESEGIANFLNNLGDTKIALILKEIAPQIIKGSFRTIHDTVDVSTWAKKMGGGGHKKAAGFTTTGTIDEVLNKIISLT